MRTTLEVLKVGKFWKVRLARYDQAGGLYAVMRFPCKSEKIARQVACELRDALNETESPVGEWTFAEEKA